MNGAAGRIGLGALLGLAWAASLRGLMAQIAGAESVVHWQLTFVWLLLPGLLTGALLGWAEHLRRTGGHPRRRWLVASPLLLGAVVFSDPTDLWGVFRDGLGAGAIGVPLIGLAGGHAWCGRGPRWARTLTGLVALSPLVVWPLTAPAISPTLAMDSARGAWVAVHYWTLLAVLELAAAIPHLPLAREPAPAAY
jgi:hypothetical protein